MRRVIVTGASKGIGLAIAKAFETYGDKVVICSRNQENLNEAVDSTNILSHVCDMSDKNSIDTFLQFVEDELGGCDILVNNAGVFIPGSVHEEEEGNFEKMMQLNLESAYYITRKVLPTMKERKTGDIVNICSIASVNAYANGGSYSISKFAMLGFSKNLREELKPHGIRVISVLPGATLTDSWSGVDLPESRLMPPEDVAQLVLTSCNLSRRSVVEEVILRPQLGDL